MRRLAGLGDVDVWQSPAEVDQLRRRYQAILDHRERRLADADLARARDRAGMQALDKPIRATDGRPRFAADPPLPEPGAHRPGAHASAALGSHPNGVVGNDRRTLEADRQLRDWKFSLAVEDMDRSAMRTYAQLCGQTLARAHARSGDRIAIGAYLGKSDIFDRAVADFAAAYADQNERDHACLAAAAESG